MEQLKPCKCGNEYPTLECIGINRNCNLYYVYCKRCKRCSSDSYSRKETVEDWNRRSDRKEV